MQHNSGGNLKFDYDENLLITQILLINGMIKMFYLLLMVIIMWWNKDNN